MGVASSEHLLQYEREAKLNNYALQSAVESLKVLYESPWVEEVRGWGAQTLEASPGVRSQLYHMANFV